MALGLIVLLLTQVLTGLFINNDIVRVGPLFGYLPSFVIDTVVKAHGRIFTVLWVMISVHVTAIVLYWMVKRQNLIGPMITGKQMLPADLTPPRLVSERRALVLMLASLAIAQLLEQL